MITHQDRQEAIRLSLTRQLMAAGLQQFINQAIDLATFKYKDGHSAWRSIQIGVSYAHKMEEKWI